MIFMIPAGEFQISDPFQFSHLEFEILFKIEKIDFWNKRPSPREGRLLEGIYRMSNG